MSGQPDMSDARMRPDKFEIPTSAPVAEDAARTLHTQLPETFQCALPEEQVTFTLRRQPRHRYDTEAGTRPDGTAAFLVLLGGTGATLAPIYVPTPPGHRPPPVPSPDRLRDQVHAAVRADADANRVWRLLALADSLEPLAVALRYGHDARVATMRAHVHAAHLGLAATALENADLRDVADRLIQDGWPDTAHQLLEAVRAAHL